MDPMQEALKLIELARLSLEMFIWKRISLDGDETVSYEGELGLAKVTIISYKIDGIQVLGLPHGGRGYEGVLRMNNNVIRLPRETAEQFFMVADRKYKEKHKP